MKTRIFTSLTVLLACLLGGDASGQTIWEAFNDHRTGPSTSPNATIYDLRVTGSGGQLTDIATGAALTAALTVEEEGPGSDDFGLCLAPNAGSPADVFFAGKCTIGGSTAAGQPDNPGIVGIRNSEAEVVRLRFNNLDPAKRYKFRGTCARGGNYNDRWTIFKIVEADGSAAAHTDGSANRNLFTATTFAASGIAADEVVLNSGDNKAGSLAGWDNINAGADGTFAIEARHYQGTAPFGNPAAGAYGYGFNAIYLAEVPATGGLAITANPENKLVAAGSTAQFSVGASSANPMTYQWQKTAPGGDAFGDITGANAATYTTPALAVAEDNTKFRVRVTAGPDSALSGEATLRVDGVIPAINSVTGSTNRNAIYITFSEPMNLVSLAAPGNYTVDSGLTVNSATVLDPQTVKLSTSAQVSGQLYTVTVNNVTDAAGNRVPANTKGTFTGYAIVPGTVSVEIWLSITGSLADFLVDPRYPDSPDRDFAAPALDSTTVWPSDIHNTYAGRMRTWITPPANGFYYFFLKSDNVGELSLSTDDSFANLAVIATDTDAATGFEEPGSTATSSSIQLLGGVRYALQVVWEEDNGTDFCQVAWRDDNDPTPADQLLPLSGPVLSYYGPQALALGNFTSVSSTAGQFTIAWAGPGILQMSDNLIAWTDLLTATSPYTTSMAPGRKFFRLRR